MSFSEASIPSHVVLRSLVKIISQFPRGVLCTSLHTGAFVSLKEENVRPSSHTGSKGLLISRFFLNQRFIRKAKTCQTCPPSSLLSDLHEQTSEYANLGWSWWQGKMGGIWNIQHSSPFKKLQCELKLAHAYKSLPTCFPSAVAFKHSSFWGIASWLFLLTQVVLKHRGRKNNKFYFSGDEGQNCANLNLQTPQEPTIPIFFSQY